MHRTDLADIDCVQLDSDEGAAVVEIGNIGELAAEPVEGVDHDDIKHPAVKVGQQFLIVRAEARCSASGSVTVRADNHPSLLVDVSRADLDLVGDRGLASVLGRIPRVNDGSHL